MELSLLPIDVGFDLKELSIPVRISNKITGVFYLDSDNNKTEFFGSSEEIRKKLEESGYKVVCEDEYE